jgi:hypothetical protein
VGSNPVAPTIKSRTWRGFLALCMREPGPPGPFPVQDEHWIPPVQAGGSRLKRGSFTETQRHLSKLFPSRTIHANRRRIPPAVRSLSRRGPLFAAGRLGLTCSAECDDTHPHGAGHPSSQHFQGHQPTAQLLLAVLRHPRPNSSADTGDRVPHGIGIPNRRAAETRVQTLHRQGAQVIGRGLRRCSECSGREASLPAIVWPEICLIPKRGLRTDWAARRPYRRSN